MTSIWNALQGVPLRQTFINAGGVNTRVLEAGAHRHVRAVRVRAGRVQAGERGGAPHLRARLPVRVVPEPLFSWDLLSAMTRWCWRHRNGLSWQFWDTEPHSSWGSLKYGTNIIYPHYWKSVHTYHNY